ncbi:conserved hypothetical protein [Mucor ambiguus]|uniref:Flavodoxin-like fold domain-containing protein n=1 Tax=Mucor ambiguus TaxID=91626 RepID=A0A0C9MVE8_9FUNG|nr:conserved hypothetical protein [Mucor ambiguus]
MERINQHDAMVFIFPMYWSNMPAIMKGYLDRVWNLGFAYSYLSPNTMKVKKVFFMTTTGASEEIFIKRDHIKFINHYFNNVVAGYCKVENSRVKIFDDAHNEELVINNHLPQAYQEGLDFDKW